MNTATQIWTIIRKDVLVELRSKDIIISMLVFGLIVLAVFNFVFEPGSSALRQTVPGILWVAILFAGNLGLHRSSVREFENAMIQGVLLCPIDRSYIYIAKVTSNVIFMIGMEIIILPVMVVFFDLTVSDLLPFLGVLFLGTLGFAGVGSLFSTMSAQTKSREIMLPVLLFPICVPIILAATKSTAVLLDSQNTQDIGMWIRLLIGFDAIFLVVCFLLFDYVLEE